MSRWINNFKNHPFQQEWQRLVALCDTKLEPSLEQTTEGFEEIARLKKVVTYINTSLENLDFELLPHDIWDIFHSQTQHCLAQLTNYISNKNINHLRPANTHLDTILKNISPYITPQKGAAVAAGKAYKDYSKTITTFTKQLTSTANDIASLKKRINQYEDELFKKDNGGIATKIESAHNQVNEQTSAINTFFQNLTKGNENKASIMLQIKEAKEQCLTDSKAAHTQIEQAEEQLSKLQEFYITIFGKENTAGKVEGGLKQEIEKRRNELESFKQKQNEEYSKLLSEINTLLPGATSAGLSSSYNELKNNFNKKASIYSWVFFVGLAILLALASWAYSTIAENNNALDSFILWGRSILYKLPIIIPVLWLTLYASSRRSEFARLEQEYVHKEAIAKSYHSFKEQINEIDEEHNALAHKLLDTAIEAIGFNASTTLDKNHGEKAPIHEIAGQVINRLLPQTAKE